MRITRLATAVALICQAAATGFAQDADQYWLKFDQPLSRLTRSFPPDEGFWRYYVSVPDRIRDDVRDTKELAKYITPRVNDDAGSCRLQSRNNYVGLARRSPVGYENARRLGWKWSVAKHPYGGKIGGTPNDQSAQVYVIFREAKPGNNQEVYTSLSFVWTENTTELRQAIRAQFPWNASPRAELVYIVLRNGALAGEFAEEVDLRAEYRKAFGREAPVIWGIVILADSNEVEPDVGRMTTDAVIRDVRLVK